MKAVIPVAGLGTRMLPATKAIPKEMLPVVDRPLIQYVVSEAVAAGSAGRESERTLATMASDDVASGGEGGSDASQSALARQAAP